MIARRGPLSERLAEPRYPHLEEVYEAGEGLLPLLRRRGLLAGDRAEGVHSQPAGVAD